MLLKVMIEIDTDETEPKDGFSRVTKEDIVDALQQSLSEILSLEVLAISYGELDEDEDDCIVFTDLTVHEVTIVE